MKTRPSAGWATAVAPPPPNAAPWFAIFLVILGPDGHVSDFLTRRRKQEDDVQHFLFVLGILFHFWLPDSCDFGGLLGVAGTVWAQSPLLRGGVGTASRTKNFEPRSVFLLPLPGRDQPVGNSHF